jgi:hypothetical protein
MQVEEGNISVSESIRENVSELIQVNECREEMPVTTENGEPGVHDSEGHPGRVERLVNLAGDLASTNLAPITQLLKEAAEGQESILIT